MKRHLPGDLGDPNLREDVTKKIKVEDLLPQNGTLMLSS